MTRSRILLGVVAIGALLGLALWSIRKPAVPHSIVRSPNESRTHDESSPALDASELRSARTTASAPEAAATPIAPAGTRPIVLSGIVLDFEAGSRAPGRPAVGVAVGCTEGFLGSRDAPDVTTDDAGRFRIEAADSGRRPIKLHVFTHGDERFVSAGKDVKLAEGEFEIAEIVLERHAKGELTGVTVDDDDLPVPDVLLTFVAEEGRSEVTSDKHGSFAIAAPPPFANLEVIREGYTLIDAKRPAPRQDGTFEPMRVVLAPTGTLRVSVFDSRGKPRAHAPVQVELARVEPQRRIGIQSHEYFTMRLLGESATSGLVTFDSVCAKHRLAVTVRPSNESAAPRFTGERARGGTLVLGDVVEGEPILVEPGGELSLRAVLPSTFRVEGTVRDESGASVTNGWVALRHPGCDSDPLFQPQLQPFDGGRFQLEFAADAPSLRVRAVATEGNGMFAPIDATRLGVRELTLEADKPLVTELAIAPTLEIRGRLIDADGNGLDGSITSFVESSCRVPGGTRPYFAKAKTGGAFKVPGLAPGRYDLLVRPNEKYAEQWVRGIDAGRQDVEVRVTSERCVRVTVDVSARGVEVADFAFLQGRIERNDGARIDAPVLPPASEWMRLGGWPRELGFGLSSGGGGSREEQGLLTFSLTTMRENPKSITLDEGDYWFGARGKDGEGRILFPIGTGLVRVNAGEHSLRFELVPAVPIRGRVRGHEGRDLAVAIARADGVLLEFDFGERRLEAIRELAADGSFSFPIVPVGEHELLIGAPLELEGGHAPHRRALTVTGKDDPVLDISLTN